MLKIFLLLLVILLIGDAIYAWLTAARYKTWESGIERHPSGLRVGCEPLSHETGDPTVLFVHGFADSPALWHKMAPLFKEAGFRYHTLQLPGFATTLENMRSVTEEDWRQTVIEEYKKLARSNGDAPVWIVAHSLGAAIALDLHGSGEINPAGIVALAPLIEVGSTRSPVLKPKTWFKISNALLHISDTVESVYPPDTKDPSLKESILRDVFLPKSIHASLFRLIEDLPGKAGNIQASLLMINSTDDLVVDAAAAEAFYTNSASPTRQCLDLTGSGHVIPLDHGWEEVTTHILTFITDGPIAPASDLLRTKEP